MHNTWAADSDQEALPLILLVLVFQLEQKLKVIVLEVLTLAA